jgi:tetratricopeptide (TPR) repeat protein
VRNTIAIAFLLTALLIGSMNSVQAGDKPIRVVTSKIVADRDFASQEVWQRKARRQIDDIAEEIRGLLGVELKVVGYAEWRGNGGDNLYEFASNMIDDIPTGDADILVGFTYGPCPKQAGGVHTDGVAMLFRGLVIGNYYAPCDRNEFIPYALIHEMVHLFGGVHVGQGTLMSPVFSGNIYLGLDPINRTIIRLTRTVDFRKGYASLDSSSLEKLVELYKMAIAKSGGDLTVLTDLGDVYRALGRYETALNIYRGILGIDSTRVRPWLDIAQCYFDENRVDTAFAILDTALAITADSGRVYYRMARFHFTVGEYEQAYRDASRAAWRGIAVDSGLMLEIRKHYVPGEKIPEKRR